MANPFEKPPVNFGKENDDKTIFRDGEAIAKPSDKGVWKNPKAESVKAGLDEITEKFKKHKQPGSEESYTLVVNSKRKPGKIVEISRKQKAA